MTTFTKRLEFTILERPLSQYYLIVVILSLIVAFVAFASVLGGLPRGSFRVLVFTHIFLPLVEVYFRAIIPLFVVSILLSLIKKPLYARASLLSLIALSLLEILLYLSSLG